MSVISSRQIDEICESFESQWTKELAGSAGIQKFLASSGLHQVYAPGMLADLVKISCERSWMSWDKRLPTLVTRSTPTELLDEFHRIPRINDYRSLFQASDFASALNALANDESHCRDLWGDAIGSGYYQQALNAHVPATIPTKSRYVRCHFDYQSRATENNFRIRGCTLLGRRRSTDSSDLLCDELCDGNRIVIASRLEAEISRVQLSIQLLHPSYALLTNLSQVNPIKCQDRLLEPAQVVAVQFPFVVRLTGRTLYCY